MSHLIGPSTQPSVGFWNKLSGGEPDHATNMTFTVLSDDQVRAILESLNLDELEEFRHVLASALHEYSAGSGQSEGSLYQQPHRVSTLHPVTKATTLFMPSCGPGGIGCKGSISECPFIEYIVKGPV